MPYYLVQAAFTGESWATRISNPENPLDRARPLVEALGGRIESYFYALGEYDVVAILELPDNVAAGARSVATVAGGAIKAV